MIRRLGASRVAVASSKVATSESLTTGSMTDLTTVGPTVTDFIVPPSGKVKVTLGAQIDPGSATSGWMGVALSGANTVAANQQDALGGVLALRTKCSTTFVMSGLTPGATTFTAKYRVDDGTSSTSFSQRHLIVEELP